MFTNRWAFALCGAVLIAACGGDASSSPPPAVPQPSEHTVIIRMTDEMKFIPRNPTITAGDTVIWLNEGSILHTATDKPGTAGVNEHNILPDGADPWDSGLLESGHSYRVVFNTAGNYTYLCSVHEALGMVGQLTVR